MSLQVQEDAIRRECEANGWTLAGLFIDVGSGADTDDRPEYKRMLSSLSNADGLMAARLDRVARNAKEILGLLDALQMASKGLQTLDLPMDPFTPVGRLVYTIMAGVAELERHLINERTRLGRLAKAEKQGYAYGAPPVGFASVDGELVPDPAEQAIIRLVRKYRALGLSLRAIAERLNLAGHKPKRGKKWYASIISRILKRKEGQND
jgi:site-specific DNA recombinase